jgi:hypothetical protein
LKPKSPKGLRKVKPLKGKAMPVVADAGSRLSGSCEVR